MNPQDQDRQTRALSRIKDHHGASMPVGMVDAYEAAESNKCWPCVQPLFDLLLTACEQSGSGWTKLDSQDVRKILFE